MPLSSLAMRVMRTVGAVALCSAGALSQSTGNPSCRCLTTTPLGEHIVTTRSSPSPPSANNSNSSSPSPSPSPFILCLQYPDQRTLSTYCYPPEFGVGSCKAWDEGLEPDCGGPNKPSWCIQQWCYVDKTQCLESDVLPSAVFGSLGTEVHFSYTTCGDESLYAKHMRSALLDAQGVVDVVAAHVTLTEEQAAVRYEAIFGTTEGSSNTCPIVDSCACNSCTAGIWAKASVDLSKTSVTWPASSSKLTDVQGRQFSCVAATVGQQFRKVVRSEYNDASRVAYMYFGDQRSGGYIQWPSVQQCPTTFNPKYRPWYASAVTGPKDMVIVVDVSGSMSTNDRIGQVRRGVAQVLDTLIETDYVTVVTFSSSSTLYDQSSVLVPATESNKKKLREFMDGQVATGGTNFISGLEQAFTVLAESRVKSQSSGCSPVILFLTDGEDSSFGRNEMVQLATLNTADTGARIFTYSFGSGAAAGAPKRIACHHNGLWTPVPDGQDVALAMASYFLVLGAGARADAVRWHEYDDVFTKERLLAGCKPVYRPGAGISVLLGVVCMDLNVVMSLTDLESKADYAAVRQKQRVAAKQCATLSLTASDLQTLRKERGQDRVCTACDMEMVCDNTGPLTSGPGGPNSTSGSAAAAASLAVASALIGLCL